MSESSLVTYRNLTKNKTVVQNKKNLYIIPHVYVGQVTTKNGVDHFATNCNASCNYVIGTDGTIGQSVSEADRPWTTGGDKVVRNQYGIFTGGTPNSSLKAQGAIGVDFYAVTMEIACDPTEPYKINDKVYNSLIKLMADIAIRNNIGELKWKADPNLVGNPSAQNVLVHRWFATKSCPGDYVYNRLGEICDKANEIIRQGQPVQPQPEPTPAPKPEPSGQTTVNYVVQAGDTLSEIAAKFGTSVELIADINHIKNVNLIYAGQKLIVPIVSDKSIKPVYYTVKPNDNLTKIANMYGTTVDELCRLNDIKNRNLIYPNQKIRVK